MNWYEMMLEEVRKLELPDRMFQGSKDFLIAWELLARHRRAQVARENRAYFPNQACATCASMALELALKSLITVEGKTPKKSHSFARLYEQLSPKVRQEVAALALLDGKPTNAQGVTEKLVLCEGTFETWRYKHEHDNADFYEGYIIAVTRALHDWILKHHPDWWPWPGVIQEE